MANNAPIGIFDSGMGGLTVWQQARLLMPRESIIYFGDGKNCPYGNRPHEQVCMLVDAAVEHLVTAGAKMIVLACNAATAAAVKFLRSKYDFPIVGMEPAIKPAAMTSSTGKIGIVATRAALDGELFNHTRAQFDNMVDIIAAEGRGFVEIVENDTAQAPEALETIRRVIEPMIDQGVDRIVLGCTHYPLLRPLFETVIGTRNITIIEPSEAVARHTADLLGSNGLECSADHVPQLSFQSVAGAEYSALLGQRALNLMGKHI